MHRPINHISMETYGKYIYSNYTLLLSKLRTFETCIQIRQII